MDGNFKNYTMPVFDGNERIRINGDEKYKEMKTRKRMRSKKREEAIWGCQPSCISGHESSCFDPIIGYTKTFAGRVAQDVSIAMRPGLNTLNYAKIMLIWGRRRQEILSWDVKITITTRSPKWGTISECTVYVRNPSSMQWVPFGCSSAFVGRQQNRHMCG